MPAWGPEWWGFRPRMQGCSMPGVSSTQSNDMSHMEPSCMHIATKAIWSALRGICTLKGCRIPQIETPPPQRLPAAVPVMCWWWPCPKRPEKLSQQHRDLGGKEQGAQEAE